MAELFREHPWQWGLRGDPHLWSEMADGFAGVALPAAPGGVEALVHEAFARLTGRPISHPEPFYVPRFDHGGMSAGHVQPAWWRDKGVPFLVERCAALSNPGGG